MPQAHDLASLLDHAGVAAGFTTRREWQSSHGHRIDLVWLEGERSRRPVVAFELEGDRAVCIPYGKGSGHINRNRCENSSSDSAEP